MTSQLLEKLRRNKFLQAKKCNFTTKNVRMLHPNDVHLVEHLVDDWCRLLFGDVNLKELVSMCHISLVLSNDDDEMVAVMCIEDHPNVPAIPPWEWMHWLYNLYCLEQIDPMNTLWIHAIAYDSRYTTDFLRPLLEALFAQCWYLEHVILVSPPGTSRIEFLEGQATRILPKGYSETKRIQMLYLMVRQHYVTKYKIRRAVEEDNDDLIPLIHSYSERLQQLYGSYYIAEMLTRHPDAGRQIIVAEEGGDAVAVLCLNETVHYNLLNDQFELIPFYGLRKTHNNDYIEQLQMSPTGSLMHMQTVDDHDVNRLQWIMKERASVAQDESGAESDEEQMEPESISSEDDYDIVNVSSIHLLYEESESDEDLLETRGSQYSAMILSYNEYEMHIYADKSKMMDMSYDDLEYRFLGKHRPQQYTPKIPIYFGKDNAFTLEIAASRPEHEDAAIRLLIEAAFECYPERDYCIMALPSTTPPFPMLEYFVRVSPKPVSVYPHELYVLHRNAINSYMSVRLAASTDVREVEPLIYQLNKPGPLLKDFLSAVKQKRSEYTAYVLLSETQIVGVAVIKEEDDVEYLQGNYELLHWMDQHLHKPGSHGLLQHFVMSPVFQKHSRFFLRELHRLSDFSAIYYCISSSDSVTSQRERTLAGVLADMVPVLPRRKPEFNPENLEEECMPADVIHRLDPPFALYLSTARLCSLPRYDVNTRIVVVGASDTSIAFLESLLCCKSVNYQATFSNVTLLAPHGMCYQKPPNKVRDMMFVTHSNFTHRHMNLISLRTYVNIVNGVMTAIDRKNKHVVINDDSFLTYDLLFLMCGEQYQKISVSSTSKQRKNEMNYYPDNVFIVNTEIDAGHALTRLKVILTTEPPRTKCNVLVYGHCLEAYCCIAALLEYGMPGSHIFYIDPFPNMRGGHDHDHNVSVFNDEEVDSAVYETLKKLGITIYTSYTFIDWEYDPDQNRVNRATFESKHRMIHLNCVAMFVYQNKSISVRTFLAINTAGLVFDGRLVIDPQCRTNDPYIYAAGTLTKYSRKYYADHMAPKYFNRYEIGFKLGQQIRSMLLPIHEEEQVRPWEFQVKAGNMLVPRYTQPISKYCILPGGLHYLSVTKPGKPVPLEVAMNKDDYGRVYVTGDCRSLDTQGFFRLHLNSHNQVQTITCLAKFEIDRHNLTSLYGKHEKLLNSLIKRFDYHMITDLFEFFKLPWASAIYYDRYSMLDEAANEVLYLLTPVIGESLIEDVIRSLQENNWNELPYEKRKTIQERFLGSPYNSLITGKVLEFFRANHRALPMYAHPNFINIIIQGLDNSPMFAPQ